MTQAKYRIKLIELYDWMADGGESYQYEFIDKLIELRKEDIAEIIGENESLYRRRNKEIQSFWW